MNLPVQEVWSFKKQLKDSSKSSSSPGKPLRGKSFRPIKSQPLRKRPQPLRERSQRLRTKSQGLRILVAAATCRAAATTNPTRPEGRSRYEAGPAPVLVPKVAAATQGKCLGRTRKVAMATIPAGAGSALKVAAATKKPLFNLCKFVQAHFLAEAGPKSQRLRKEPRSGRQGSRSRYEFRTDPESGPRSSKKPIWGAGKRGRGPAPSFRPWKAVLGTKNGIWYGP